MRTRALSIALIAIAILALLAIVLIPRLSQPRTAPSITTWPTQGWQTATPEEEGLDSAKLAEGLRAMKSLGIRIDSLLLIRDGKVILDATFAPYDGQIPHDLASVTKTFMTTLIGIAAGQGLVDLDKPVVSYFPGRTIQNLDARKQQITVRQLAMNVNGFESGCKQGDAPTIAKMTSNPDWVQAALDRKMAWDPGTHFCYDSPGMHLLSAILQEATGMTTLEFARQNLFAPLGITEVAWDKDPQGITRGAGDLHLKPRDAAKLGYLWLSNGRWEGKQIVPADWVREAVKTQNETGEEDAYGYGWWVGQDEYYATGRGGQKVVVVPALNVVLVTTGSGFETDQIDPYLQAAIVDLENPLPSNPQGTTELQAALQEIAQPEEAFTTGPLPEKAKEIEGKTYVFEPNPLYVETLSFDFSDPAQAVMLIDSTISDEISAWPIGLDGKYRLSPEGDGLRGYWADPSTFIFEMFDIGVETLQAHFEGDRLLLGAPGAGAQAEGQLESP